MNRKLSLLYGLRDSNAETFTVGIILLPYLDGKYNKQTYIGFNHEGPLQGGREKECLEKQILVSFSFLSLSQDIIVRQQREEKE